MATIMHAFWVVIFGPDPLPGFQDNLQIVPESTWLYNISWCYLDGTIWVPKYYFKTYGFLRIYYRIDHKNLTVVSCVSY